MNVLATSPTLTKGTLTGDQLSGLQRTLTLAPGVVVQVDAGGTLTPDP